MSLFQSRKFQLVLLDAVVVIVGVVVAQFLSVEWQQFTVAIVAPITAVITAAIVMIRVEDAAALSAGAHPNQNK